jgi:glutamate racemase
VKIGVFDSGLGGLAIAQAIIKKLPEYDYLYLGDTKRVPYGGRSQEAIHEFTSQALSYLFENDCQLVILACNTASAEALRKSQQEYLPKNYPDRRVLGMIIPTAEAAFEAGKPKKIGVLATPSTVESKAYLRELLRLDPSVSIVQVASPLLVPLLENEGMKYIGPILNDYLKPLLDAGVERIVLGCTHYCLLKEQVRQRISADVISQDEVIPEKLADYLSRHPEIDEKLSKTGERNYRVTDITASGQRLANELTGEAIKLERVELK